MDPIFTFTVWKKDPAAPGGYWPAYPEPRRFVESGRTSFHAACRLANRLGLIGSQWMGHGVHASRPPFIIRNETPEA